MISGLPLGLIGAGAGGLLSVCAYALLRRPRRFVVPDENDTVAFVLEGPADGELVSVAGRVSIDRPLRAPSGTACAMYELYGGADNQPARALRRSFLPFLVDDGVQAVRIDPSVELIAFDLPTAELEPDSAGLVVIERRLEPGARVQVVGCVRRVGAPGHQELLLTPPDGAAGVALTWLG